MELRDPVSCLLCLDAFERTEMIRVQLRAIAGNGAHQHLICQRCSGAIAAEYLYVQNSGKTESAIEVADHDPPSGETWDDGLAQDREPGIMQPPVEPATAGVGDVKTVEAPEESAENPRKGKKEGRKESH